MTDIRELEQYPDYGVTSDGGVWSRKSGTWRQLKSCNVNGYRKVNLIERSGEYVTQKVHILVAHAFLGPRPDGMDINHMDGNKAHNSWLNLEYVTRSANVLHSVHVLGNKPGKRISIDEKQRRARVDRCMRRRALAERLWLRDGRASFSRPARASQKLDESQVLEIRKHAASRTMTRRAMAKAYGVSRPTIDRIISGHKWAHV